MTASARREVIEREATAIFAERGYQGASMDEIARRSGVSAPVVYDHFDSKADLHRRLLERTRDELLAMWRQNVLVDEPFEVIIPRAIEAWAAYVEAHPYAARMFFRETSGDPAAAEIHKRVQSEAQAALGEILGTMLAGEGIAEGADAETIEMAAEIMRSGLTGLAVWWAERPHVPREAVAAAAIDILWLGFERTLRGERWSR